ncbi:hypothetical protein G6F35_013800 [Rhizopus arrhizus]|nr:hypothetical protein G6F35_013800 [Rhizopus arrhizus]
MGIHQTAHAAGRGIPARAGVGLKADHYRTIIETRPDMGFFEVHAENYMGAGGPPHRYLTAIREHYPLSLHGVGLSIGADRPLDQAHLLRLKALNERYEPGLLSEHLAWSSHGTSYLDDLLPLWPGKCCWRTPRPTSGSRRAHGARRISSGRSPGEPGAVCCWT